MGKYYVLSITSRCNTTTSHPNTANLDQFDPHKLQILMDHDIDLNYWDGSDFFVSKDFGVPYTSPNAMKKLKQKNQNIFFAEL